MESLGKNYRCLDREFSLDYSTTPIASRSRIPRPVHIYAAPVKRIGNCLYDLKHLVVLAGEAFLLRRPHRYAQRHDPPRHALRGGGEAQVVAEIVSDATVRRAFKNCTEKALDEWLSRHEREVYDFLLSFKYIIDIDNTVKPIYGHQEGAELGYNPVKPGRPSHNYHSFFIGRARISLGIDVRPGKQHSGRWGMKRLWTLIDSLPAHLRPALIRGDFTSGVYVDYG